MAEQSDLMYIMLAFIGLFLVVTSISTNAQQTVTSLQFWIGFVIVTVALWLNERRKSP